MRYFRIYADKQNIQLRIMNWSSLVRPHIQKQAQAYMTLSRKSYLKAELEKEVLFPDIISNPIFMVSKEFANLIRMYCPEMRFKYMALYDEKSGKGFSYQIPQLKEIDCLSESSEVNRRRNTITKGILDGRKTEEVPIFRLKALDGHYVMASLAFVESAYRREVRGMRIEEFMVR